MKKLIAAILAMAMLFTLAACGASDSAAQTTAAAQETTAAGAETEAAADTTAAAAGEKYVVGVCQLVPHDALDAATQGFVDRLTELLGEDNVEFDVQVAAGDSATCANIVNAFVADEVDLIMANATPSRLPPPPPPTSPSWAPPSRSMALPWALRTSTAP